MVFCASFGEGFLDLPSRMFHPIDFNTTAEDIMNELRSRGTVDNVTLLMTFSIVNPIRREHIRPALPIIPHRPPRDVSSMASDVQDFSFFRTARVAANISDSDSTTDSSQDEFHSAFDSKPRSEILIEQIMEDIGSQFDKLSLSQ